MLSSFNGQRTRAAANDANGHPFVPSRHTASIHQLKPVEPRTDPGLFAVFLDRPDGNC